VSRPRWILDWSWGGATGSDDCDAAWSASAAIDSDTIPIRTVSVTFHPTGLDLSAWLADPASMSAGFGRLYRVVDGVATEVMRGVWRDVEVEPHGEGDRGVVRCSLGDDLIADDSAPWPGPGQLTRYTATQGGAEIFFADRPEGDFVSSTVLDIWRTGRFVDVLFQIVTRTLRGVWGPIVFGAPGTTTEYGSPAYLVDEQTSGGVWRVMIARHAVAATQVRLWCRTAASPDQLTLDGHGSDDAGLYDVLTTTDADLGTYSYVEVATPNFAVTPPTGAIPSADDDMYVSWTEGPALPGGAGSVLAALMEVSAARADLPAWRAAADVLDRYVLGMYVVEQVKPIQLASEILKLLPCSIMHTLRGAAPMIHPLWDELADGEPLIVGQAFDRASAVQIPGEAVTSVSVRYGHPAQTDQASAEVTIGPGDSSILARALSLGPLRQIAHTIDAPAVWTSSVARMIADDAVRLRQPSRRVGYRCDPGIYGPGAPREIREGQVLRLTDPTIGAANVLCYVGSIEATSTEMRMDLVLHPELRST